MSILIIGISTLLQFIAALLSVRLIHVTGRWKAWSFIAIAMALMGIRRSISIYRLYTGDVVHSTDLTAELIALSISVLMVVGVLLIGPIFKKFHQTDKTTLLKQFSIDQVNTAIYWLDSKSRFIDINETACNTLNYSREELLKMSLADIDTEFPIDQWNNHWQECKTKGSITLGSTHKTKEGVKFPVEVTVGYFNYEGRENLCAFVSDITERKKVDEELKKAEEKYRTLVANIPGVTFRCLYDDDWTMEFISNNVEILTGYPVTDFIQNAVRTYASIIYHEDAQYCHDIVLQGIKQGKPYTIEYRIVNADGDIRWVYEKGKGILDADGKVICIDGVIVDVTERKKVDEQLSFQASHDALTGLNNRHEFERRAERLLSTTQQDKSEHALCFMDLDQFKIVNDTCGHIAGDELLRQLGQVLQETVRKRDTLARLGGDEFGVLMEHCSPEQAHRVASSLLEAIQDYPFSWEGQSFKVGASIGVVAITETATSLTEILKQADAACYMAKDAGRNRIHFYHQEDAETTQRHGEMQWVTRIQQALEEDRFCLYAQAIVPLDRRTDTHYELLIRMIDNQKKIVSPGAFLPSAERYNLIGELDRWVVAKAFSLLIENPLFLEQINFVSINLSGQSLTDNHMLDFIITRLGETGIDGEKVCFEITETAAISNIVSAKKFIAILKGIGCQFALDDFGSGLSSFGYLKQLPVDYLKIDGMFVKNIVDDPIDHAMVKSINEIGQVMGMQTIAEFVENDEIKGMLREIGVNYAQGYGIGKPMPLDELLARSSNVTDIRNSGRNEYD